MYQLTDADALKLSCLFFELVRNYVDQLNYGIVCNKEEIYKQITDLYAAMFINNNCNTNYKAYCKAKSILDKNYDYCMKSITICEERSTSCENCI